MSQQGTPSMGKLLYWLFGAPAIFLGVLYAGILPVVLLGTPDERPPATNLIVAPYGVLLLVFAVFVVWACWRAVRGDARALRPFPWPVWVGALVLGLASGAATLLLRAGAV